MVTPGVIAYLKYAKVFICRLEQKSSVCRGFSSRTKRIKSDIYYWIFWNNFCPLVGRNDVILSMSRWKLVVLGPANILKIGLQKKFVMSKINFELEFCTSKGGNPLLCTFIVSNIFYLNMLL